MFAGRGLTFIQSLGQEDYNLLLLYMQFHMPSGSGVQEQALCVCGCFIPVLHSSMFAGPVCFALRVCEHAATE